MNYSYGEKALWPENLSFEIYSGDRIAVQGLNGAGKTTLIQLVLGNLTPSTGSVVRADYKPVYIDQEYTLLNSGLTVYEQAQQSNTAGIFVLDPEPQRRHWPERKGPDIADPAGIKNCLSQFYINTAAQPGTENVPAHLSHHLRLFFFSTYLIYNRHRLWRYPIEPLRALPFYHHRHHDQKP